MPLSWFHTYRHSFNNKMYFNWKKCTHLREVKSDASTAQNKFISNPKLTSSTILFLVSISPPTFINIFKSKLVEVSQPTILVHPSLSPPQYCDDLS